MGGGTGVMNVSHDRFTFAEYSAILLAARASGYRFARFADPVTARPSEPERVVYLRHDIDNCVESALLMAELEARLEARSTYFTMVRSDNYNPFTGENVRRLRRICELGHEVGLHFSGAEHEPAEMARDPAACIRRDAALLEDALGAPVRAFSFHNPTEMGPYTIDVPGLVNAYADRFFADARYMSESNMRWGHGSPETVLATGEYPVVQILVHPLSYREDFRSDRDVLMWFLRDKVAQLLELNAAQIGFCVSRTCRFPILPST